MRMSDYVNQRLQEMRNEAFATTQQITLGKLIELLKALDAEEKCTVEFAFCGLLPWSCDSWRGSYCELAISYCTYEQNNYKPRYLSEFIETLEDAVGNTFYGWKGGEYTMGEDTPIWVDNLSESHNTGVIGICADYSVDEKAYRVYIRTDYCQYILD